MTIVTVFGAVHVDICAIPQKGTEGFADRPGTVSLSVGGTGFNIAADLVRSGIPTQLFAYTSRGCLGAELVRPRLIELGIGDDFLFIDDLLPLSAFVGFFENRDFKLGVTASLIDCIDFDQEAAARAVAKSDLIVIDCNLSIQSIEQISRLSWNARKDIAIAGVSSIKIHRYLQFELLHDTRFRLVSLNKVECESVYGSLPNDPWKWDASDLLQRFKCSNLLISLGADGHVAVDAGGINVFPAPRSMHELWPFGAGDALLAAHCAILATENFINWTKASDLASSLILDVMQKQSATV